MTTGDAPGALVDTPDEVAGLDVEAAAFFAALARGRLAARECGTCAQLMIPWLPACPRCGGRELHERALSGGGTVYSWIRVHRQLTATPWSGPFTVVTVELQEGPRVLGILLDQERPELGAPVRAELDGQARLAFRTADPVMGQS